MGALLFVVAISDTLLCCVFLLAACTGIGCQAVLTDRVEWLNKIMMEMQKKEKSKMN